MEELHTQETHTQFSLINFFNAPKRGNEVPVGQGLSLTSANATTYSGLNSPLVSFLLLLCENINLPLHIGCEVFVVCKGII